MQRGTARRTGILVALAAALLLLGAAPASASGEIVQGFLRNNGNPVPGVSIEVTGPGTTTVGTAVSSATGAWSVPLPGPGTYQVTLKTDTLPKGVALRFAKRNPITTAVGGQEQKAIIFAFGVSNVQETSKAAQSVNLLAQGLRFGLLIALAAVGLSLIFGTTGLTNFAHGEMVTFGALAAYYFHAVLGLPLLVATVIAVLCGAAAGYLSDAGLWSPLRRRGTGLIAAMIVSIGLSLFVRSLFLYIFGGDTRTYPDTEGQKAIGPGSITLTTLDYTAMAISVVALLGTAYFLLRTRLGKATRAVADNPALASASGIDVDRVIKVVWSAGGGLAALAGVLLGIAQQVNVQMGFQILLLIFASVTLGGLGTAFGALVGSLVVGILVETSTLIIPAELKNVGALGILIIILLVRPQGILGRAQRVG